MTQAGHCEGRRSRARKRPAPYASGMTLALALAVMAPASVAFAQNASPQSAPAQAAPAKAAPALPDPATTDPLKLGWMQGSPPPRDKIVRMADGSIWKFPQIRWSFNHMRELLPTKNVRHAATSSPLVAQPADIDGVSFKTMAGDDMTWKEMLAKTYTDGILVMHDGKVIYERYFGAGAPHRPHQSMSVTKSFVGTLAAMLAAQGKLDPKALVTKYVPELKDSAYGDATVRDVMDMRIGVKYSENYTDPNSEIWAYARAGGILPRPPGYKGPENFAEFLIGLVKEGEHGKDFAYKTSNAEVLTWIVRRASGKSLAELLHDQLWEPMGATDDGYLLMDSAGDESGGGGLNATLRDMARFGELMRNDGKIGDRQVIPAGVVADIRNGGDQAAFAPAGYKTLPNWSYRNMWWVTHNANKAFMARGIHGQAIYVDPTAKMVIVRFASHPIAANGANDPVSLPAYAAMAAHLMKAKP